MTLNAATLLLDECEQGLRKLVAQAAGEGDYASVQRINNLARAIAALAGEGRSTPITTEIPPANPASKTGPVGHAEPSASTKVGTRKVRPPIDAYPQFFQRGDELVKVGWSKKDRKEYNHRAPREVVALAGTAVRQIGAKGKMFNGDMLLPLKDPTANSTVPNYQVYVALAWLKHLGVVEQHGRRSGYTLVPEKQIDSIITAAWPELPEWRA